MYMLVGVKILKQLSAHACAFDTYIGKYGTYIVINNNKIYLTIKQQINYLNE